MRKRLLFFLNPNAGHQELKSHLLEILQIFTEGGYEVTVHPTRHPGDATEQIRSRGAEFDTIVCAGGDGTLNEAISGLMSLERRPLLGYLPCGTVNDMAATLGLNRHPVAAAKAIVEGSPKPLDTGHFAPDRWFAYVAGFGAFTDVSYQTPQEDKRIFGRLAYLANGVRSLGEIRPLHVRFSVNGADYEDDLLLGLVCSTTSVGGFHAKAEDLSVKLDDGLFEVVLAKNITSLNDLNALATLLLKGTFDPKFFYTFQTDRISFSFDEPVKWTLDGEFGGQWDHALIETHRKAVQLLV